jgi:hypothetical protein
MPHLEAGMGGINLVRVLLGGIVAGVVANAGDFVINTYLLAEDMSRMATRLGLDQSAIDGSMTTWIVVDFLYGILIVFAYAAMRPRFGAGPKTAVIAGVTLFLGVTVVLAGFQAIGVFAQDTFVKNALASLVVTVVASLAGGAVYKE